MDGTERYDARNPASFIAFRTETTLKFPFTRHDLLLTLTALTPLTDLNVFSIEDEHPQSSLFPGGRYFILGDGSCETRPSELGA